MKPYGPAIVVALCAWSTQAHAIPISQDFFGRQLTVAGEFVNAVPVPSADREFAPLFLGGATVTGSIRYDTNQPDLAPDPDTGVYRVGALSVDIPELGLSASRSSGAMQISPFNDTATPNDQFFAFVNGVDAFSNAVGLPDPVSFDVLLFGDLAMLADDSLPTGPLAWNFGNLSFDFTATDGTRRQVLMTFLPAPIEVPEPATLLLSGLGLVGVGVARARRKA